VGTDAILLRTQSDGRLVRLVREGYETAFEEIVRRYRRPLNRFAASIVGGRSEDVTQDSFRKALVALRREDGEIELRPWLYRIVRNTALNDLRDRPPAAAELAEELMAGTRSAAAEAEERAEVAALTAKLRALPERQRAALVMRELEGMGHAEIAGALGISGGAARQAIARGRATVRGGLGALVPLPLLRVLAGGGDAATEAAVGAGATATGIGALKVGLATVVVAGGIGAGVAIDHHTTRHRTANPPRAVAPARVGVSGSGRSNLARVTPPPSPVVTEVADDRDPGGSRRSRRHHGSGSGTDDRPRAQVEPEHVVTAAPTVVDVRTPEPVGRSGGGPGPSPKNGDGGGPGPSGPSGGHDSGGHGGDDRSGHGGGSRDDSGSGSGSRSGSSSTSGSSDSGSGSGSGSSDSGSGSGGGRGSDDSAETLVDAAPVEAAPVETPSVESSSSGGPGPSSSSSSGDDGSGSSGGHDSDDDSEISP
jgi:RNA polymerase sigma factor (sigma-70 family)